MSYFEECIRILTVVSRFSQITDGLLGSLEKFECLQVIKLDGCHVEGNELAFIGRGCKSLKVCSVSKCSGVTDEGVQAIVEGCRDLDELDLTCCREITDLTLASIAKSCRGLRSLKMESCGLITHKGLSYLGSGCTSLESLDLTDCRSIDDEGTPVNLLTLYFCRYFRCDRASVRLRGFLSVWVCSV